MVDGDVWRNEIAHTMLAGNLSGGALNAVDWFTTSDQSHRLQFCAALFPNWSNECFRIMATFRHGK